MGFKSSSQRKAAFAKMNYRQLKHKGVFLSRKGDADKDGVQNAKDCKPLNPKEQGIIHDIQKRHSRLVKVKEKKLEKEQDELLKKIDKENTTLKKQRAIQSKIDENKRLKEELKKVKTARFAMTPTGKVVGFVKNPKNQRVVKKELKSLWRKIT